MSQATLTIELLKTGEVFTETFQADSGGEAWSLALARSNELQRQGYAVNTPDDKTAFHPCVTTIAEG